MDEIEHTIGKRAQRVRRKRKPYPNVKQMENAKPTRAKALERVETGVTSEMIALIQDDIILVQRWMKGGGGNRRE